MNRIKFKVNIHCVAFVSTVDFSVNKTSEREERGRAGGVGVTTVAAEMFDFIENLQRMTKKRTNGHGHRTCLLALNEIS